MKKALGILVAVMALVMALSSCSAAGVPSGLEGVWKTTDTVDLGFLRLTGESFMKIEKDVMYSKTGSNAWTKNYDITKCTCDEITLERSGTQIIKKYELSGNNLTISYDGSSTKYTKE